MVFEDKKSPKMLHLDNDKHETFWLARLLPFHFGTNLPFKQVKISKDQNKMQLPFLIFK